MLLVLKGELLLYGYIEHSVFSGVYLTVFRCSKF